jgi:hypothetical protein
MVDPTRNTIADVLAITQNTDYEQLVTIGRDRGGKFRFFTSHGRPSEIEPLLNEALDYIDVSRRGERRMRVIQVP